MGRSEEVSAGEWGHELGTRHRKETQQAVCDVGLDIEQACSGPSLFRTISRVHEPHHLQGRLILPAPACPQTPGASICTVNVWREGMLSVRAVYRLTL